MSRVERNEATVMIFPVWWWSVPAVLKGWIDRVWNNGWAYGDGATYPHHKMWMIGIAADTAESYRTNGYAEGMRLLFDEGLMKFCGIQDRRLEILYQSLENEGTQHKIIADAGQLGKEF
jgi:NAD(P)H dehydrogenase (quinone)